jgi:PhoPQ-activated pathogenicity-related protein
MMIRTVALSLVLAFFGCSHSHQTGLDRYVAAPDDSYRWEVVSRLPGNGYTLLVVDLTSQTWRTAAEVDRPVWKHWLLIIKPDAVRSETGLLFINGGANGGTPPAAPDPFMAELALGTGSVVSEIRMIPNQPLTFIGDDTRPRTEDDLIAHTWIKYMTTGDETWPARNPMTKAAVRAMDTVTAVLAGEDQGKVKVDRFVVAGGSKRGWTTWTTAAVDRRVVAIVPIVIDVLNCDPSMRHHFAAYGFWAPAIGDYLRNGVMKWVDTTQYADLLAIEDPYSYRDRFTMPKLIINATGDQFFLPDSSQFYFDDLPGEKHLRYVPNADHSLRDSDARQTLYAFYESVVRDTKRPELSWSFEGDHTLHVYTPDTPLEVRLWQATNPSARDFRVETLGKAFSSTTLQEKAPGHYVASVAAPPAGWTAYFVELTYPGGRFPLKLTTPVRITPDTLPFKDKPLDQ